MDKTSFKLKIIHIILLQEARLYDAAPDPLVHHPVTGESVPLLSVAAPGLPLIINFGSCT